jgi:hypothetical protein
MDPAYRLHCFGFFMKVAWKIFNVQTQRKQVVNTQARQEQALSAVKPGLSQLWTSALKGAA